jgi:hypothetical protein
MFDLKIVKSFAAIGNNLVGGNNDVKMNLALDLLEEEKTFLCPARHWDSQ